MESRIRKTVMGRVTPAAMAVVSWSLFQGNLVYGQDAKDPEKGAEAGVDIIEVKRALGAGLPEVASVKAGRLLESGKLKAEDEKELAGIAVESAVRAGNGPLVVSLLDRYKVDDADFWRGHAQVLAGDLNEAALSFSTYEGPLKDRARLCLAYVLMADGREGTARKELRVVRESQDPEIAREARMFLNELELIMGRTPEVLNRLNREGGGKSTEVQFLRARGALQLGQAKQAEALLRDLMATPGVSARLYEASVVLSAEALLAQSRAEEAGKLVVQFLEKSVESSVWHEAFELVNRCRIATRTEDSIPLAVCRWVADPKAPDRGAYAMFWLARWFADEKRNVEALGLLETLLQLYPGHRYESDALRLAMRMNGELRADARVLQQAQQWREKYGGGGASLVDFIAGGIFFARGDLGPALASFQRSADMATGLSERRRALHNAAVAAATAGQMMLYQSILGQIRVAGGAEDGKDDGGGSEAAASLELDHALQLAAKMSPEAEVELQEFIAAHQTHPRMPEALIARAELALLDVPYRVKDAATALQAAGQVKDLDPALRERIDYVTVWLREAEESLRGVVDAGLAFLKAWPNSARGDQIRMKVGDAYYRLQDLPNARTQFELLATEQPSSSYAEAALFFAGKAAMELGTPEGLQSAIDIWGDVAEREGPLAFQARYHQALAKRTEGLEKEALSIIEGLASDKNVDADTLLQVLCQRIELQLILGMTEPRYRETAISQARELKARSGLSYLWQGRIGALLAEGLQKAGREPEAMEACYDVVNAGLASSSGPANPAEFYWFYWAGFRAVAMLDARKQWEAAAKMAETLAQTAGDRAGEAKEVATRIRVQHFIWDGNDPVK
jgi:tetratricopeptide (TPR) repeat protein